MPSDARRITSASVLFMVAALIAGAATVIPAGDAEAQGQPPSDWPIHSLTRPQPPVVDPGPYVGPVPAPSDAKVLFDGHDLSHWRSRDEASKALVPAKWKLVDGAVEVVQSTGSLVSADSIGDCQLHIEWMAPSPPKGEGQDRGNSGVFLMGMYEVQVLDSYRANTYPDGQAAAVYGQYPPLVNASRPPGQWQTYDIVFHRPRFDSQGKLLSPARMTVLHNGVLVQDNVTLTGPTAHQHRPPYVPHADRLPLELQDHGHPVRFRNIWVRAL